jgi:hypothetical protein
MFSVEGLVEGLRLFERNKVPLGFEVLSLTMYSALDADRNELISMRVYPTMNPLTPKKPSLHSP